MSAGFAFRGDLTGVDAPLRAGLNRYLRGREREINAISRTSLRCSGGPFDGSCIELETGQAASAPFAVGQWSGRYVVVTNRYGRCSVAEWRAA